MAGLIQILNKNYADIANMSKDEYKDFLEKTMENLIADESYAKYKVVREKKFYRFFLYPPVIGGMDYMENVEQKSGRLELLNHYRDIHKKELLNETVESRDTLMRSEWVPASKVQEFLGITKRTLYSISDDEDSELEIKSIDRELMVNRNSLLTYLNRRHIIETGLGFERMYKEVRKLSVKSAGTIQEINDAKLEEILNSEEYAALWEQYLKVVPEERRIYRERQKKEVDGYKIHSLDGVDEKNLFEVYNPNIMISPTPIHDVPQMYTVSYVAAVLDTTTRTVLRYCEYGYIPYFRVGGKYMFCIDDITTSKKRIHRKETLEKDNVGRKRKIEHVFETDDIFETRFYEKFKSSSLIKMKDIYPKIGELSKNEGELQKKLDRFMSGKTSENLTEKEKKAMMDINNEIKDIRSRRKKMENMMNGFRREFFNNKLRDIDTTGEEIVERIYERQKTIRRLMRYQKRTADESFRSTLGETIKKLQDEVLTLKGSLIDHFINS